MADDFDHQTMGAPETGPVAVTAGQSTVESHEQDVIEDVEVDDEMELDSAMGSEIDTISTSLRTSAASYQYLNGRRYQDVNGIYQLPNDIREMERLELQHTIFKEVLRGKLHLAPLHQIQLTHALDVGCGTGNWTIEFANENPQVKVIGTDLVPIQPEWVPSNCQFYIDDALQPWSFHERFDFIHTRCLGFGVGNWDHIVDQAYNHLQPGGYIELQEFHLPFESPDNSIKEGSALWTWGQKLQQATSRIGVDIGAGSKHAERLRAGGFRNVDSRHIIAPLGPWAKGQQNKHIGLMGLRDILEGIDSMTTKLFLMIGESPEQINELLTKCKAELTNPSAKIHACFPVDIVWGQRPPV